MVDTKDVRIEQRNFQLHVYSDASKTFGVGGILDGEIYSARWNRDVTDEHIGALELEALLWTLQRFKHQLAGTSVLAWLDNVQALTAINRGLQGYQPCAPPLCKSPNWGWNTSLKCVLNM